MKLLTVFNTYCIAVVRKEVQMRIKKCILCDMLHSRRLSTSSIYFSTLRILLMIFLNAVQTARSFPRRIWILYLLLINEFVDKQIYHPSLSNGKFSLSCLKPSLSWFYLLKKYFMKPFVCTIHNLELYATPPPITFSAYSGKQKPWASHRGTN